MSRECDWMCNACEHVCKKHVYKPNSGVFFIFWAWNRSMDKSYTMFRLRKGLCALVCRVHWTKKFRVANLGKEIVRQQTYLFFKTMYILFIWYLNIIHYIASDSIFIFLHARNLLAFAWLSPFLRTFINRRFLSLKDIWIQKPFFYGREVFHFNFQMTSVFNFVIFLLLKYWNCVF